MIIQEECLRTRSNIIAFSALNNDEIIYALQHKTVKSFSSLTCKPLRSITTEYLSTQTTAISFHKTDNLVAIANGKTIYIINTKTKEVLQTIISYAGDITTLHFIQNSPYLITGTKNGRVVQYRYDGKSSLSRLCSFPFNNTIGKKVVEKNYVGAIDSNDKYIACSGYGGAITIIKLHSLTHKQTIQTARVRVNVLKFITDELLISASVDGNIYFHDLNKYKSIKTINSPIGNITQIIPITGEKYALIIGESNKISLLDLVQQKVISNELFKFELDLKFVELIENTIFVVLENNHVEKITLPTAHMLRELILHNNLEDAYKLLENNPILYTTPEYDQLEKIYKQLYTKAIDAFTASKKREAIELLEPFKKIESKKNDLNLIFNSFEQYQKFQTLVLEKKYHIAYAMVEKYPALKQTHPYTTMESGFKEAFSFAQKQIRLGRDDLAHDTLSIYASVNSKKALVKLLLKQNKDFLHFLRAIQAKNYQNIALLIKKNENFKQLGQYQELLKELQLQLQTIKEDIFRSKVDKAIEKIQQLQYIQDIKEPLKELYILASHAKKFLQYYEQNDFLSCYETIDKAKQLDQLELAGMLEKHWQKLMDKCENLALKGDLKGIKENLGELITLKTRAAKMGDIIRLSFQTKIKILLAKRTFTQTEAIIYSYIDIFGLDTEIKTLMNTYEKLSNNKLALTNSDDIFKEREAWLNSEVIIGEYKR
ncbi:hypothetical protein [Sulfurimonas marina]|uniref:WD40 repeat domain-containing protein n=1 Tax=Sulfurimonas marina TaxID=2590551 RepID=A0A7M1B0Q8_9BACT|nr:hypothetical protein [Sulfurimonas marina]QOP42298.1 hypothetical protein FJR03_11340 [Sulfurimonas marina]